LGTSAKSKPKTASKKSDKKIKNVKVKGANVQVNYADGTGYYIENAKSASADKHIKKAFGGSNVKSVNKSSAGVQVNYKNGGGYWVEYESKKTPKKAATAKKNTTKTTSTAKNGTMKATATTKKATAAAKKGNTKTAWEDYVSKTLPSKAKAATRKKSK